MPKKKEFIFEVDFIHDWEFTRLNGRKEKISSHRFIRGLTLQELVELVKNNEIPTHLNDDNHKITLIIRGVNF